MVAACGAYQVCINIILLYNLELLVKARDVPVKVSPGMQVVHVPPEGEQAGDQ